jgi:pimeloyl-ACP methyl ester carboxylesterase
MATRWLSASLLVLASAFQEHSMARINNIVLVHGAFVDGSSWAGLYDILKEDGFDVSIVQNPTISLEGDVAATNLILDEQVGPAVLVGHSYGGVVITEAGRHPKVAALVYIAAFAPDKGESVKTIVGDPPSFTPPKEGYLFQDKAKMAAAFGADVDPKTAGFWADSQVPFGLDANNGLGHRARVEGEAELVSRGHGRQDDPAAGATADVEPRGLDGRRGPGKSRDLRLESPRGGGVDRAGGGRRLMSAPGPPILSVTMIERGSDGEPDG